jgi:protein-S-isoprenylcysteine O-methyltransferase Ste14
MSTPRKFWMRWRVRIGYPVALLYLVLASPTQRSIAMGAAAIAFGLAIRAAAAGHLRKNAELATSGIYARTRNPLYLGSAILAAGFIVAGHSLRAGLLVGVYFVVFYYLVMRNEEEDLRERFNGAFEEYAARVPLFFPNVFGAGQPHSPEEPERPFSWEQYRRNREYRALIGTLGGLAILWLRMWVRRRYGF